MPPVDREPTKKVCPGPAGMSSGAKPFGSGMVCGLWWADTDDGSRAASRAISTPSRRREDLLAPVGGCGIDVLLALRSRGRIRRAVPASATDVGHFVHAAARTPVHDPGPLTGLSQVRSPRKRADPDIRLRRITYSATARSITQPSH